MQREIIIKDNCKLFASTELKKYNKLIFSERRFAKLHFVQMSMSYEFTGFLTVLRFV